MPDTKTTAMPSEDQVVELKELRQRGRKAYAKWKQHAEQAKKHKADWEATNVEIGALIDEIDNPTPKLPFGKDTDEPSGHTVNPDVQALPDAIALKYDPETDQRWRDVPIKELGLSESICDKLEHADIFTLGHLVDYQKTTPLDRVKGIGEAAVTKIAEATIAFWETASERFPPIAPAKASSDEEDTGEVEIAQPLDDDLDEGDLDDNSDDEDVDDEQDDAA